MLGSTDNRDQYLEDHGKCLGSSDGGSAWVAQLVKPLTLGFSSGHDFMGCGTEPCLGFCA